MGSSSNGSRSIQTDRIRNHAMKSANRPRCSKPYAQYSGVLINFSVVLLPAENAFNSAFVPEPVRQQHCIQIVVWKSFPFDGMLPKSFRKLLTTS